MSNRGKVLLLSAASLVYLVIVASVLAHGGSERVCSLGMILLILYGWHTGWKGALIAGSASFFVNGGLITVMQGFHANTPRSLAFGVAWTLFQTTMGFGIGLLRSLNHKYRTELSARIEAQGKLEVLMADLQRSNRDLEQFAYVASHDLQEPLRKITSFGERLNGSAGSFNEKERDYVERIMGASRRMQTLISDLLSYSKVSATKHELQTVELDRVAHEVISDLEVRIEQLNATVEIAPLPPITADPTQMRQLIQNFTGNALKFHKPDVPPVVKISGALLRNGPVPVYELTIKDNGIGIDKQYHDRIFGVFQRLHSKTEYEGTGIGLAVCSKIVEKHGGSIRVESVVGEGTSFIITIPQAR
jgi:signal transduction histidine kinase